MVKMKKRRVANSPRAEITVDEALLQKPEGGNFQGYCIVCSEEVVAHEESERGKQKQAAHFEHKAGTGPPQGPPWIRLHETNRDKLV